MYLTPEVEYEVIRDAVSHKLDRPLFIPSNKVWRDSTQTKTTISTFQIGNYIKYTNEGHNEIVELVYKNTNDTEITKYSIKFLHGNKMAFTNEFLK